MLAVAASVVLLSLPTDAKTILAVALVAALAIIALVAA